jgi:hypothetical protein
MLIQKVYINAVGIVKTDETGSDFIEMDYEIYNFWDYLPKKHTVKPVKL